MDSQEISFKFFRILHHDEFSKEDTLDDVNKEYEYNNYESFDPSNNAFKKVEEYGDKDEYSYPEYGQVNKKLQIASNNPNAKTNLCNPNDETLLLIRKLNGHTDPFRQNCDDKKMRALDVIRAINGNGGGSINQYQSSNNGISLLSKIFNFARNLPNIY